MKSAGPTGCCGCRQRRRLPSRFACLASSAVEYFLGHPPNFFKGILFVFLLNKTRGYIKEIAKNKEALKMSRVTPVE